MEWVTTSTILERLRGSDEAAWGTFAGRFRPPLLAFARRYGLRDSEAEDVVQETLLAFSEAYGAGKYDPARGRLSSWLFGIAWRQIANHRRQRAREYDKRDERGARASFLAEVPDERQAEKAWDAEWEKSLVNACLQQARHEVAQNTYRAFELTVRQGRSPDEAAAELGLSRNAVYVAKHRVLKRLNELMKEYEDLLTLG